MCSAYLGSLPEPPTSTILAPACAVHPSFTGGVHTSVLCLSAKATLSLRFTMPVGATALLFVIPVTPYSFHSSCRQSARGFLIQYSVLHEPHVC